MPYRKILTLVLFSYASTLAIGQEILDQLASRLTSEYTSKAKELIILQTDKTVYQPGTEIWFRAYSISSNGFSKDEKNKVIYVELVTDKDVVLERVLLNKEALQYNGSIKVPYNTSSGYYQLRAYTRTILQEHPSDIFLSSVYIAGTGRVTPDVAAAEPIFKFYTEGDQLINGVNCTVVFTATDKHGNSLPVSGHVKDNFGNEAVKFSGNGLGKFVFQPYSKDRTYKVYIKTNNSAEQSFSLPAIKTSGYQLALQSQANNELAFRVALGDSAYNKKAASYLLGVAGGKVCFASEGKGMYMVNIPVNTLPHGLVDFYLFDANKELKSRRTVFNSNYNSSVAITADRPDYGSRQKAKLNFAIIDNEGKPVKAVFSVSVTDKKLTGEKLPMHEADIYTFDRSNSGLSVNAMPDNEDTKDMLAIIAGSNGSGSNSIAKIEGDHDFYWDGLQVKGKIADKQNAPLASVIVMLLPEQQDITLNDSTDNKGIFDFRELVFYGDQRFLVMIPSVYSKQQKFDVASESIVYPSIHTSSFNNYNDISLKNLPAFKQAHADSFLVGNTRDYLQQLALQEEGTNKKTKSGKNGLLGGRRITGEQLDKYSLSNTVDAVKMLPGVVMMGGRLTLMGGIQSLSGDISDVEPLLIVDGVNTRTSAVVDYLNSIPPSNIDYIEVLSGPEAAAYGSRGGNGAIVVKTSNQLREKKYDAKDMQTIVASGFYKEQKFYEPPYDKYAVREATFTDNRSTIYWNGQVITDDTGKASVSFYTADLKNDYLVTVQGMTDKGELIFKTYAIKKR